MDLLGAELIPTPNFGLPVQWLALGDTQLHLFERDLTPTSHHHLGITVSDLEPVYRAAERRDAFDHDAFGNHLVELPGDVVQMYVRDPAGNLVEIDHHGVDRLPAELARGSRGSGTSTRRARSRCAAGCSSARPDRTRCHGLSRPRRGSWRSPPRPPRRPEARVASSRWRPGPGLGSARRWSAPRRGR